MFNLVVHGLFLDNVSLLLDSMHGCDVHALHSWMLALFVFLGLIFLNTMIGILCAVALRVSSQDKDFAEVLYLHAQLLPILEAYDQCGEQSLSKFEFDLLLADPELHAVLVSVGVDCGSILAITDAFFQDAGSCKTSWGYSGYIGLSNPSRSSPTFQRGREFRISFVQIMQLLQELRGTHMSRIADIVAVREYVRLRMDKLEAAMGRSEKSTPSAAHPVFPSLLTAVAKSSRASRPSSCGEELCRVVASNR